jgi:hypothetical protein
MLSSISLIVFSRNDAKKALDMFMELNNVVDDIVLVDSSNKKAHKLLLAEAKHAGFKKLRIFYTVALGYPEVYRAYGVSLCHGEWILYLDTDERIPQDFVKDLRRIVSSAKCDAFAIKRYEETSDDVKKGAFTMQTRLFKKDKVHYRGILHEQPIVNGVVARLDDRYYIKHVKELKDVRHAIEYGKISRFWRYSYSSYYDEWNGYFSKLSQGSGRKNATFIENAFLGMLRLHARLFRKKPDEEIGWFGYFMLFFAKEIVIRVKVYSMRDVLSVPFREAKHASAVYNLRKTERGRKDFEIAKMIDRFGIIKLLRLDDPRSIKALNSKYAWREEGVELLMKLIESEYDSRRKALGK